MTSPYVAPSAVQSAELLRLLVETVEDYAMYVLDTRGNVVTWNAGAQRIKGYTASEVVGSHFSRFYPQEDVLAGKCERELEGARRDGRFEDEGWRVRKDGSKLWANVVITALRSPEGELLGFAKVTRDLTARRAAEEARVALARAEASNRAKDEFLAREREALRRAEDARNALATTLRSIGDAVITTDAAGKVTMMNTVAERLTGWTEEAARNVHLREVFRIVNEESRKEVESPVERVLREGTVVGLANHTVLIARDGVETPIDDSGAPIRGDDGAIRGVVLVFRSASEEKQALLRRAYLADVAVAIASSLDYRSTLARVAELTVPRLADWCSVRFAPDGSAGPSPEPFVAHVDPAKVQAAREWFQKYPPDPNAPRGEANVLRTGQSELYAEISDELLVASAQDAGHLALLRQLGMVSALVVPITARNGVAGVITLVRSETARRYGPEDLALAEELGRRAGLAIDNARLFEAAQDARRAADDANRAKDEFLARISHELRTPLNAILGWGELLASPSFDAGKRARGIDTIVRNAHAMTKLIEDLLDVSRIMSGKLRIELEPVELLPIVDAAIEATRPAADAKQVRIERAFDVGKHVIRGDPSRLQQITWNLLNNAVKFTPAGGRIEVSVHARGSAVELTVSDTGRGIEPAFLPHVFEPFRQAESGKTGGGGGLGLGLSIAKQLVELHGGFIAARSEGAGKGTTFTVHLPRLQLEPGDAPGAFMPVSARPEGGSASLRGRHVLVVDDEHDARTLIQTVLEEHGARVTTAASVEEALDAFDREPPDALVSDIGMPRQDGYDLIRQVRERAAARGGDVPAVALTAYARSEDRMRAIAAGYQTHLSKPVEPAILSAVVAMLAKTSARSIETP